ALLSFILGDYQSFFGSSEGEYGIGTVYGEKIDPNKYNETNGKVQDQDRGQAQKEQKEYTEEDIEKSQDKAWNFLVDSTILKREYDALEVSVSDREFNAYLMATDGFPILEDLSAQFFTDSLTGLVSEKSTVEGRKKLKLTIDKLKASKEPQAVQQWKGTKQYYTDRRKQEKYLALLDQGAYVTKLEAEAEYLAQKETKNISFVARRYDEIKDISVKISESELKNYYEEHKSDKKYANRSSSREVKLFDVSVAPSRKDSLMFNKNLNTLKALFLQSANDSIFVAKNSDRNIYFSDKRSTAVPEGNEKANKFQTYPASLDSIFKSASIGQIVGPYTMQENVIISKVLGFTPTRLKARHLLISTNSSKDEKVIAAKRKTADSLLKVINTNNFTELVTKYTEDPGSKTTGGLYENFLEAEMVKEFGSFCATQAIGKIGIVKTDFGFHIIEVLERDATKFPLLVSVSKTFKASIETIENKESEITNILYKLDRSISKAEDPIKKSALFDTIVARSKYFPRAIVIEDNSPKVTGFTTAAASNKILELAYAEEASVGNLTSYPIKDKDKYVIAMISSIKEKGEPNYEHIKAKMKEDLLIEKKSQKLITQMLKYKTMLALAKASNTTIMNAEISFSNPQITGGGYEPEIIGALFASVIKDKKRTLPLKGKTGVYVIQIDKTTKAPTAANYKIEREQMYTALKGSVQGQALGALRKKADIVDNRKLNELRIRL
ncbi:MAG: peptidylprolyl isomerase, partial [Flavobacteriia bacterium]|nr:peptidylprolyl isomerase [Flavobacteriia bacterium]